MRRGWGHLADLLIAVSEITQPLLLRPRNQERHPFLSRGVLVVLFLIRFGIFVSPGFLGGERLSEFGVVEGICVDDPAASWALAPLR